MRKYAIIGHRRGEEKSDELHTFHSEETMPSETMKHFVRALDSTERKQYDLFSLYEVKPKKRKPKKQVLTTQDLVDIQWQQKHGSKIMEEYTEGISMNALKMKYKISIPKIRKFLG